MTKSLIKIFHLKEDFASFQMHNCVFKEFVSEWRKYCDEACEVKTRENDEVEGLT